MPSLCNYLKGICIFVMDAERLRLHSYAGETVEKGQFSTDIGLL